MSNDQFVANIMSSKSNEWYTPEKYLKVVREVLDGIELDPASSPEANERVKADSYYTKKDNGLGKNWPCRSFFNNPPYGRLYGKKGPSNQDIWNQKAIEQFDISLTLGLSMHGIQLLNANTETAYYQRSVARFAICLTDHRIPFDTPPGQEKKHQPTKGNMFIYFGPTPGAIKFAEKFTQFGSISIPGPVAYDLFATNLGADQVHWFLDMLKNGRIAISTN